MDLLRRLLRLIGTGSPSTAIPPRSEAMSPPSVRRWKGGMRGIAELARRLEMTEAELRAVPITYRVFEIPKRAGGYRRISAPDPALRDAQRRILRRVLSSVPTHPAALGFERGHSTVENAAQHAGRPVLLRMDIRDFFGSTGAERVANLYAGLGWDAEARRILVGLTTNDGSLPQGAPTSPRLSNLVNRRLDARLSAAGQWYGARYSRYADDLTFSFDTDETLSIHGLIRLAKLIVGEEGYQLHERRKLHVRRPYERQVVSGLVVNVRPRLARERRRWLRAVEHHAATGRPVTLSDAALRGWRAYSSMVDGAT